MNRRRFLKAGAQATILAAASSAAQTSLAAAKPAKGTGPGPAVLVSYTSEDHRRRLQNIALAERGVRACLRKHLITDYLPGHCVYNLGEYPCRKPWNPDAWDEHELDKLREKTKDYPPYIAPCLDMSRAQIDNEDELYLHTIPYLQFPVLLAGRPFTGERAAIPGIEYPPEEQCFWTRHPRAIWKHYQANPNGPHSYGWWDSCPGRPEARPAHARWLKRYLPLVEEGTWAWLEIADSDLFPQPLPQDVVASAFANREFFVVLANYGRSAVEIVTTDTYVPIGDVGAAPNKNWSIAARSLKILQRKLA